MGELRPLAGRVINLFRNDRQVLQLHHINDGCGERYVPDC
jgi:hypothetical protein